MKLVVISIALSFFGIVSVKPGRWDILEKINEGISTQKEARIDTLRAKFNHFKRIGNESCQQTIDHLSDITNELQGLGAKDITDHEVVKKLLRSVDSSFDTLVLMIRE